MNKKRHKVPKKLIQGKTNRSQPAKIASLERRGGKILTNLPDIDWNAPKLTIVSVAILAPITFAIVLSFKAGNIFIALVLIGIIVFMGLIYLALRYIEDNEF